MKTKSIILVGGGTGGHIVPIFALYQKIKELAPSIQLTVVGGGGEIEKNFYSSIPGYKIIRSGKLRRHLTLRNIGEFINAAFGLCQSYFLLRREKPRLIFSKGGYVSLPLLTVASWLHIPYFVHESDSEIGLTNRWAAKKAARVYVGYPADSYSGIADGKLVYSGPIMRDLPKPDRSAAKEFFGLNNNNPVVLFTGGSQGAQNINRAVEAILEKLLSKYNIIHQTGYYGSESVGRFRETLSAEMQSRYFSKDFLGIEGGRDLMIEALGLADLVVARAGANTIAELAQFKKPTILIPWKHSAANHQNKNAKILEDKEAAVVISDDDLSANPEILLKKIDDLLADRGHDLDELSKNIADVFPRDGLEKIAADIIKYEEV